MNTGRIVLIIVGIIFILGSLIAMAAGGGVIWASQYRKDDTGFHVTDAMRVKSLSYAVTSDTIEIDRGASRALDWLGMDKVKVEVENDDPSRPVFIGIASCRDVDAYLSGVEHDEITSLEVFNSSFDYDRQPGTVQPELPGDEDFWLEEAGGVGAQEIEFDLEEGEYTILVMNEDASEGIELEAVFGIKSSGLIVLIGVAFLVHAVAALAGGIVMLVFGIRRPGSQTTSAPPQQLS